MLRVVLLLAFSGLTASPFGDGATQFPTPKSRWDFYLSLSRKYSPESYFILSSLKDWEKFAKYAEGSNTEEKLIENYNTVVHESCHGYQFELARKQDKWHGYFVAVGQEFPVVTNDIFNSVELNSVVPDSLQTKIGRYDTYIGDGSFICSQNHGFFGLMEEFSAYYHGSLASARLKPYYEQKYGYKNPEPWIRRYVVDYGSSVLAFYEFRMFMAWYLEFAKKKHPDDYRELMENLPLRKAWMSLFDKFEALALQYEADLKELEATLNANGARVKIEDRFFQIYSGNTYQGYGHYLDEIRYLKSLYKAQHKLQLDAFRI